MNDKLFEIHKAVSRCRLCAKILGEDRIIPRSGFPPSGTYTAMIIGCEPGQNAEGLLTPEQYKSCFDWRATKNQKENTVCRLFKAMHSEGEGVDWNTLFYTNSVKCPATPKDASRCYSNCRDFLQEQIRTVNPRIIVVLGRAADRIGIPRAARGQIIDCIFQGYPCIVVTHPQGAKRTYLVEIGQHVRNRMSPKKTAMMKRNKQELILKVGAMGGSISVWSLKSKDGTRSFIVKTDESTLKEFMDEEDANGLCFESKTRPLHSFNEALNDLGQYAWHLLYPTFVHQDFRDQILTAVRDLGGKKEVARWKRKLEFMKRRGSSI